MFSNFLWTIKWSNPIWVDEIATPLFPFPYSKCLGSFPHVICSLNKTYLFGVLFGLQLSSLKISWKVTLKIFIILMIPKFSPGIVETTLHNFLKYYQYNNMFSQKYCSSQKAIYATIHNFFKVSAKNPKPKSNIIYI